MKTLFFFVAFFGAATQVHAATFAESTNRFCAITMNGEIKLGDNERFKEFLRRYSRDDNGSLNKTVCLNSPGGNYNEGLLLAQTFQSRRLGTVVARGSQCYSTCAIIFMFGTGMNGAIHRQVQMGAAIGFHAPYINEREIDHPTKEFFSEGVAAVRRLFEVLYSIKDGKGFSFFNRKNIEKIFPAELMARMLLMKSDELLLLKTVNDVGRWDIFLITGPYSFKNGTVIEKRRAWRQACKNLDHWNRKLDSSLFDDENQLIEKPVWSKDGSLLEKTIQSKKHKNGTVTMMMGYGGSFGLSSCKVVEFIRNGRPAYYFRMPAFGSEWANLNWEPSTSEDFDESWMTLDPTTVICDENCQKVRPFVDVE